MKKYWFIVVVIFFSGFNFVELKSEGKPVVIKIKSESHISDKFIKLAEISEIHAKDKKILQKYLNLSLGYAPKPNEETVFDKSEMRMMLYKAGVDFETCEVIMPEKIKIKSAGVIVKGEELIEIAKKEVLKKLPWDENLLEFRIKKIPDAISFPKGNVEIRSSSRKGDSSVFGPHQIVLMLFLDGNLKRKIDVSSYFDVYAPVYVSTSKIEKGKIIDETDITIEKRSIKELQSSTIYRKEDVIGKEAKLIIPENAVLNSRMFQEPMLVKKGEIISILVKKGALEVISSGEALENGKKDQFVKVREINNKKVITVKIIEKGKGEITISE